MNSRIYLSNFYESPVAVSPVSGAVLHFSWMQMYRETGA